MSKYDKFYEYLADLHQNHVRLLDLLQSKLKAVDSQDINKLDEIMKEEQVFVLVSKSFDSNIQRFRNELSLSGEKLSDIIPELPDQEQQRFRTIFKQLKNSLDQTQALNQNCQDLLEERLYVLNKNIRKLDTSANNTYTKPGDAGKSGGSQYLLTKSV